MKRVIFALTASCMIAALAWSQDVLSRNAVGYVKVTVPKGGITLVRMDFESLDGTDLHAADVLGDQLPLGSFVYTYDAGLPGYVSDNKSFGGWSTNVIFDRGMGFWLTVPSTAASNEYSVFLMGEVPDRFSATNTEVNVMEGINQLGYGYPAEVIWTNTDLAKSAALGDILFVWDGTNYVANNLSFGGWADPNLVIQPGQGFWFQKKSVGVLSWDETKPYTWP